MAELEIGEILSGLKETADPIMYQYFKNLKNRTIVFNMHVDEAILEYVILPILEWDNDGTGEKITIYLNSCGGEVHNGLALCDIIENLKTPTEIIIVSYAYSMGGLIAMAGYNNPNVKVKCYRFSTALIHGGSSYLQGTSHQVKDHFKFMEKYEERIKRYILSHSNIVEEKYDELARCEWYMDSDDMLNYGIVDEIIPVSYK